MDELVCNKLLFFVCLLLLSGGCRHTASADVNAGNNVGVRESNELPLPTIPAHLTEPAERVAYVAEHYWDALDFSKDARALDTAFMEQSFSNYTAILAKVSDEATSKQSIGTLLERAKGSERAYQLLDHVAEKYLDDPNSPVRNEDIYIIFLKGQLADTSLEAYKREIVRYRLEEAMKNRPGTIAADFRLVLRNGKATTLLGALSKGQTLLMFYDPDCDQCAEVKERLLQEPIPDVQVLAVDATGNRNRWEESKWSMPGEWSVGFATDAIEDEEIYVLRAMPTLYLLDADGRVILKDFNL